MYNYNLNSDYYNYDNNNYNQPVYEKNESKSTLYNPYEGYIRGNMFKDLYNDYKNNKVAPITPTDEKQKMLLMIDAFSFAAHDINLYLDIYPNDLDMITLYNQYMKQANTLQNEYERLYGPLVLTSNANDKNPWAWEKGPWPWDN